MDKIAAYCSTRNGYTAMSTAAKSLLSNTAVDHVYFLTEDDEYPETLPEIMTTINVSGQRYFPQNAVNAGSPWSYMANMRLAFGKMFPDLHQVLYLDTDTIVLGSIDPVFETPLGKNLFAMVREDWNEMQLEYLNCIVPTTDNSMTYLKSEDLRQPYPVHPYYNSGVMLMNLDRLRETRMDDAIMHRLNTVKLDYPDQDAINILCRDSIVPMPHEYNVIRAISPDFPEERVRVRHFASDKPLWKSSLWQKYRRMTWEEAWEWQREIRKERQAYGRGKETAPERGLVGGPAGGRNGGWRNADADHSEGGGRD